MRVRLFGSADEPFRVGDYVVTARIGEGALGVVYAAYDPELDRRVALKLVRADRRTEDPDDPTNRRLLREGRALAKLRHPNIVGVYGMGSWQGHVFVAMEYVEGVTLRTWQRSTRREPRMLIDVYRQAAQGLAAAHEAGIVHRDFKPENVLVGDSDRVRVLDFGLAAQERESPEVLGSDGAAKGHPIGEPLTMTGAVLGTPAYMSPEQIRGAPAGPSSDQFSWCVSAWEGLVGHRPFAGETAEELFANVLAGQRARTPNSSAMTRRVRDVLDRGLSLDPTARWPNMRVLIRELDRASRVRRLWLYGGLAICGAVAAFGWANMHQDPAPAPDPCSGAGGPVEALWAEDGSPIGAVEANSPPFVEPAVARASRALADYRERWRESAFEACVDAQSGDEAPALTLSRRLCLDDATTRLAALVAELAEPSPGAVQHVVSAVEALPSPELCADARALASSYAPAPENNANEVAALRQELSDALAQLSLGDYEGAMNAAAALVERAEALEYEPLVVEALNTHAEAATLTGAHEAAWSSAERGYVLSDAASRIEAGRNLLARADVLERTQRGEEALIEARRAERLFWVELGDEHPLTVQAKAYAGFALIAAGRYPDAERELEEVIEMHERKLPADHLDVALAYNGLSMALMYQGRYRESLAAVDHAVEIRSQRLGDFHPSAAGARFNKGMVQMSLGDPQAAVATFRECLEAGIAVHGPDSSDVIGTRTMLARALATAAEYDLAESQLRAALESAARQPPDDPGAVSNIKNNLADVLLGQGVLEEARRLADESLEAAVRVHGPEHPVASGAHAQVAQVAYYQGRYGDALLSARRAVDLAQAHFGADLATAQFDRLWLGLALHAHGRHAEAVHELARTLAAATEAVPRWSPWRAQILATVAIAHADQGQHEDARARAEELAQVSTSEDNPPKVRDRLTALAGRVAAFVEARSNEDATALARLAAEVAAIRGSGQAARMMAVSLGVDGE